MACQNNCESNTPKCGSKKGTSIKRGIGPLFLFIKCVII